MRGDLNTLHAQHKRQMKYTTRGKQLINFSVNFYSYNDNIKVATSWLHIITSTKTPKSKVSMRQEKKNHNKARF